VNLCHFVPIYLPGILPGCSKYIQDISEIFVKRGHRVTVVTSRAITGRGWVDPVVGKYSEIGEEIINGVRVKRLDTQWPITTFAYIARMAFGGLLPKRVFHFLSLLSAGPYLARLKDYLEKERYEAIHATAFPFALVWQVEKVCSVLGVPFVLTPLIHFEDPRHGNPFLWGALRGATRVIACSHYEKERIVQRGMDPLKIDVIPMGITLGDCEKGDGEGFRRRYGLQRKKIILFAGTKDYNKGAIHLLLAAERLSRKRKDWILVAIGLPTSEWKEKRSLLPPTLLLDLGYAPEKEKQEAFEACDLLAVPSRYDSFGIAYLEAWRCGKPVIGARVGAIPEVIEEGRDGLLVEFGNVDHLVSALDLLLNQPDRCVEMGERGRRKVIERFNWDKNIETIERVFLEASAPC
jgi:glycosyltransferase involved in cell wall biosynthesis